MMKISEMPKYEVYKDSGVEWLGDIPASWSLLANKHIFRLKKKQVGKRSSEYDLLSLTLRGVIKRDMENPEGKFPAEFDTYQEVQCGDFIFCLFDVEETPRTVGLSPFNGMITGAYTVFELNDNFDNRFLYYFYMNLDAKKMLKPLYRGLRNTIPKDSFLSFKTFVPPHEQQTRIANFLDKKTALIDEAISIKEKQINLLKEHKQIIIQQAVTQGLDPNVPMKDSGVDWIGEIPEHWEIIPLKHLCKFSGGGTPSKDNLTYWEGGTIPWVSPKDMKSTYIFETQDYVTEKAVKNSSTNFVAPNSLLLVVRSGILQRKIPVAINTVEVTLNQDMKSLTFNHHMTIEFMLNFIVGNNDSLLVEWTKEGATVESIEHEYLANGLVCVPPVSEQNAINEYLSSFSMQLESAISLQAEQIEKLKEYKTTLINSAVTGKIKITPEMVEQ
ncbi:restriction endonuclease subunit S [Escherichia coli]|nr:restriction endonuclease subunit S [Escherichia coli]HBA3795676.1 restriction endonuclease subunit S [Escherichia coli]